MILRQVGWRIAVLTSVGGVLAQAQNSPTPSISLGTQSPYLGSVAPAKKTDEVMNLSFGAAVDLALKNNLGLIETGQGARASRAQRLELLSALLPHLNALTQETVQQINLKALGFNFHFPGVVTPTIVGPFNYFDVRAKASEDIDLASLRRVRGASLTAKAAELSSQDSRELVLLVVGNAYLQVIAAAARVKAQQAQVKTAEALFNRAKDMAQAGLAPGIDPLRAQVEFQSERLNLINAINALAKSKLTLARAIGLPAGQEFEITEKAPYSPLDGLTVDQALALAYQNRKDLMSAQAALEAAEADTRAARVERLPALSIAADYGDIGLTPAHSHGTFSVTGKIMVPIYNGGRIRADQLQADAVYQQRKAEYENLRGQVDFDVRTALLDTKAAAEQVEVAKSNVALATQNLDEARDRFSAGVTDSVELVQAQQSLAVANEQYIDSLYAFNLGRVEVARAIGLAEQKINQYLGK